MKASAQFKQCTDLPKPLNRSTAGVDHTRQELQQRGLSRAVFANDSQTLTTLNFEQGNGLATQLADLYQYMLYELVDVGQRGDQHVMRKLVSIATSLRDGFAGAAEQLATMKKSA